MFIGLFNRKQGVCIIFEADTTQRQADNVLQLRGVVVADREKMQL